MVFRDNNVTSGAAASCFKVGNPGPGARARLLVCSQPHPQLQDRRARERSDAYRGAPQPDLRQRRPRRAPGTGRPSDVLRNVIDNNGEGVFFGGGRDHGVDLERVHRNVIANSNSRWNIGSSSRQRRPPYNHVWNNCLYATNPDASFNSDRRHHRAVATRGFALYRLTSGTRSTTTGTRATSTSRPRARAAPRAATWPRCSRRGLGTARHRGAAAQAERDRDPHRRPARRGHDGGDAEDEEVVPHRGLDGGDLTAGGTRFSQAIGTTPLCCPGRTSLFSGRYAHNTMIEHNLAEYGLRSTSSHTLQAYLGRPESSYDRGHLRPLHEL